MNERTIESDFGAAIAELSMEQLGIDVDAAAHECDKEGFCAVQLNRNNESCCNVFRLHGVSLEWSLGMPHPSSDIYELRTERNMIETMETTARKWHEGQFRKDGKTPYVEHPKAVVSLVGKWGFEPETTDLCETLPEPSKEERRSQK